MRILVLTSNHSRHLWLVQRLCEEGNEVLAWAEQKGMHLNQERFSQDQTLLAIHSLALENALNAVIPEVAQKSLPIKTFERGIFADHQMISHAQDFSPDIVIIYGCGIVGSPFISTFKGRMIGSHQGLPQYYRGSGSNFFAFLNKESSYMGISIHVVDTGIDTGPVIMQYSGEPTPEDTYYSYSAKMVLRTIESLLSVLTKLHEYPLESLTMPLPASGNLYKRIHFTPHTVKQMFLMLSERSFYGWYQKSVRELGRPQLLGTL